MQFLKTKNYLLKTKRPAFTLMEILVATAIFAVVMVLTTGVLGQSTSFRGRINATRETSDEAKRIADMITRDVRSANASASISLNSGFSTVETFKSGVVLIGSSDVFSFVGDPSPTSGFLTGTSTGANILVIATKDSYKVYLASNTYSTFTYKTFPRLDANGNLLTLTSTQILTTRDDGGSSTPTNGITSANTTVSLVFAGFAPDDTSTTKQQPYVQFYLKSQTKNYDSLPPNSRARMEIRSSVTARSFAN